MAGNGPQGSTLVLASSLPRSPFNQKVRFLGCVEKYNVEKGVLFLKHDYPLDAPAVSVEVDIELVKSKIQEETKPGMWLNIMGYVTSQASGGKLATSKIDLCTVDVQAVMVWSAGVFDLAEYEESMIRRQQASRISPSTSS